MSVLLEHFIESLRSLSGAECATVYVDGVESAAEGALLLTAGTAEPAPELGDPRRAQRLLEGPTSGQPEAGAAAPWRDSADPGCLLVRLEASTEALADTESATYRGEDRRRSESTPSGSEAWVGLRFSSAEACETAKGRLWERGGGWPELLRLGATLVTQARLVSRLPVDATTGLPDRRSFHSALEFALGEAHSAAGSVAVLLINPDEFVRINEVFGREAGDLAVRQVAEVLRTELRADDHLSRYGGVTFAVILVDTAAARADQVAHRLLDALSSRAYGDGSVTLDFSIGLARYRSGDEDLQHHGELVRRADQALNFAKKSGGGRSAEWEPRSGSMALESFDRLAGIFTGNVAKDYRNMVLLWDTVNVIARSDDLRSMAGLTVERIGEVLKPDYVGFCLVHEAEARIVAERVSQPPGDAASPRRAEEAARERLKAAATGADDLVEDVAAATPETPAHACYSVPLIASANRYGSLSLEWWAGSSILDSSDTLFLKSLALQVAMACQRIRLSESEIERREGERRRLKAELAELREAVRRTKLVYRSSEMEEMMATVHRVADTEATILITGPSGTGKELLARTIHELGSRRERPFVVVDCGSIPPTLIESELFGHERGAYTGAAQRRGGRLLDADRGTVLLDEIGELPLDVQSRLLRFTQEKVVTPVGGSKARRVDVRILAATNRDLTRHVARGQFREDLFYRLNVVRLRVPPLADRPDDVMHLVRHFLELYAAQYHKGIRGLTQEATRRLLAHDWPGNVRELQNRVMRAVLLAEGSQLTAKDLGLDDGEASSPASEARQGSEGMLAGGTGDLTARDSQPAAEPVVEGRLQGRLSALLAECVRSQREREEPPVPVGRWVGDALLVRAGAVADSGAAAAELLGLAPSTFRRRLAKARSRLRGPERPRGPSWPEIEGLVARLVDGAPASGRLLEETEEAVLRALQRSCETVGLAAEYLGVSQPTYRKRCRRLTALR